MYRTSERVFDWVVNVLRTGSGWVLRHPRTHVAVTLATIGLNIYLFVIVPKGFFPQQDNGRMIGIIQADQDTSFQAMDRS